MLELYFIFYRIPKMMTQLARERNRSAVAWSLLGVAAWIAAEFGVALCFGVVYGVGAIFFGWEPEMSAGARVLLYVTSLAAAIGGFTLVRHVLLRKSAHPSQSHPSLLTPPPPPPQF